MNPWGYICLYQGVRLLQSRNKWTFRLQYVSTFLVLEIYISSILTHSAFVPSEISWEMLIWRNNKGYVVREMLGTPDLAKKLRILLSGADVAHHTIFVFSWPTWCVYGFALATKGSRQNGIATRHYCQARNQGREKAPYLSQILNCKYWNIEQILSWPPAADYLFHQALDIWYFAEVSALELTVEYSSGFLRRVILPSSDSMLRCAVPVDGVRCCRIALLGHSFLSYWSMLLFSG